MLLNSKLTVTIYWKIWGKSKGAGENKQNNFTEANYFFYFEEKKLEQKSRNFDDHFNLILK